MTKKTKRKETRKVKPQPGGFEQELMDKFFASFSPYVEAEAHREKGDPRYVINQGMKVLLMTAWGIYQREIKDHGFCEKDCNYIEVLKYSLLNNVNNLEHLVLTGEFPKKELYNIKAIVSG